MRALRLISVFIAAVALLATASPVVADTRDVDAFSIPFLPCQAGVPDVHTPAIAGTEGAYPHACFVPMMGPGIAWQASTGEWILFNLKLGFNSQAECEQFVAASSFTVQVQEAPVPFETLPCQQLLPGSSFWVFTVRFLSHPLPPGTYTAAFGVTQGTQTTVFTQSVNVIPQG